MSETLAVFGGSFNPIHIGHVQVIRQALHSLAIERLIALPTFVPPHKEGVQMAPFDARVQMLELAINHELADLRKQLLVSDLERQLPPPSYTYQTLRELKKNGHAKTIMLIIGYDMFIYLPKWKNLSELIANYEFVVLRRGDEVKNGEEIARVICEIEAATGHEAKLHFLKNELWPYSSTELRSKIGRYYHDNDLEGEIKPQLSPPVWDYIKDNGLYKKTA